ncbi:alpha/beta fold hydrolase [Legionella dresdenensis]|uniref:Alpha/beta fold hydrolase n=1 Tax=Legionella dresdenensis TaxID=450200 RepID=A0ABV8CEI1_9GAMM
MDTFFIEIPGLKIACKAWGDKNLPPMLALHGWLDNANSFAPLASYLSKHFYLIAVDLPGHGLSSHLTANSHYHFVDGILNIIQLINELGYQQIHLLSHSLGACLASLVAGVIPERILSLALIEALGPFTSPEQTCRDQLAQYAALLAVTQKKDGKPYPSLEDAAVARTKRGHLDIREARILCERGVEEQNGAYVWRHDRRLLSPVPLRLTENQVLSCLQAITAKSCLILASNGFSVDEQIMSKRIEAVQGLQIFKLEGGHHVHMEHPDTVAQCLGKFYS